MKLVIKELALPTEVFIEGVVAYTVGSAIFVLVGAPDDAAALMGAYKDGKKIEVEVKSYDA